MFIEEEKLLRQNLFRVCFFLCCFSQKLDPLNILKRYVNHARRPLRRTKVYWYRPGRLPLGRLCRRTITGCWPEYTWWSPTRIWKTERAGLCRTGRCSGFPERQLLTQVNTVPFKKGFSKRHPSWVNEFKRKYGQWSFHIQSDSNAFHLLCAITSVMHMTLAS